MRIPNTIVVVRESLADELAEQLGRTDVVHVQVTEKNRSTIPARLVKPRARHAIEQVPDVAI